MADQATPTAAEVAVPADRLDSAFAAARTGALLVARDGTILDANAAIGRFLACPPGGLVGRPVADLFHADDRADEAACRRRLLAGEIDGYSLETRFPRGNDDPAWARLTVMPVFAADGTVAQTIDQVVPIAEAPAGGGRRRASVRHNGHDDGWHDPIALMSHELRGPLTGIRGFSELLSGERIEAAEAREMAGIIHREAQRMTAMLDGLVLLGRLRSGAAGLTPQPADINAIATTAVEIVQRGAPDRAFDLDLNKALPLVQADHDRVLQAVVHLLTNAVAASPDDSVVTVRTRRDRKAVRLSVVDRGVGIDAAELERVFAPFARIDRDGTRSQRGVGLGLSIAREIARLHGGQLWAESSEGLGSTFHLRLPVGAAGS